MSAARPSTVVGVPSARNLLVTVFGDAVAPHGHDVEVSVRSLATLLEPFGVNERSVRTSLTRLVNDGLLVNRSVGRRSFYSIADDAVGLFGQADARIYGPRPTEWDGTWTLAIIDPGVGTAPDRARLRQELTWAGLGQVGSNVMGSPVVAPEVVAEVVRRVGSPDVLVTKSEVVDLDGVIDGATLAGRSAALADLDEGYRRFVDEFSRFTPDGVAGLDPVTAFELRVLLVASYRRLVLTDPGLPAELLPGEWSGSQARSIAAELYRACAESSETFLTDTVETASGDRLSARSDLAGRFAD